MNCKVIIIRQCITSRCSLGSFSCKRVLRVSKPGKEAATPASHKTCSGTFGMQLSTMQWLIFRRLSAGSGHLWRRSRQLIVSYSLMQCKGFMNADSSTVTCVHRGEWHAATTVLDNGECTSSDSVAGPDEVKWFGFETWPVGVLLLSFQISKRFEVYFPSQPKLWSGSKLKQCITVARDEKGTSKMILTFVILGY